MDINFHYFAVKAVAVKSGFPEEEAQLIAFYSQFVDDFTNMKLMDFEAIPEFAQYLATKTSHGWKFNPVTTGFDSVYEMARLAIEENQKNILAPFHFIPADKKLNQPVKDRSEWRVVPGRLDKPSLIQKLLLQAKEQYKENRSSVDLIRIGTLLHIFADTYAHQGFSGSWDWENHAWLTSAVNNIDGTSVRDSYSPKTVYMLPSIGHTNVSHTLDDSNISFSITQKLNKDDNKYSISYSRNNTHEYLLTLQEILNYLRSCLGQDPIDQKEWDEMSQQFTGGLLTPLKDKDKLKDHWKKHFSDINFSYNKQDQYNLKGGIDVNFFHYNVIADEIRRYVNG